MRPRSLAAAESGRALPENAAGFYVPSAPLPKSFRNVGSILLSPEARGVLRGRVIPVEGTVFEFRRATMKGRLVEFRTAAVGGVSYGFQGELGDALTGTLRRFQNDRPIAAAKLRFTHTHGHGE